MKDSPVDKAEELREVTREANGALKDIRAAIKEARAFAPGLVADAQRTMDSAMAQLVGDVRLENAKALEKARERNDRVLDETEMRLTERVNNLVDILLGKKHVRNLAIRTMGEARAFDIENTIKTTDWSQYVDGPPHEVKEKLPPALVRKGEGDQVQVITPQGTYETREVNYVKLPDWDKELRAHCWLYSANFVHPDPWSTEFTMGPDNMASETIVCKHCMTEFKEDLSRTCNGPEEGAANLLATLLGGKEMASAVTTEQCGHCGAKDVGSLSAGRATVGMIPVCHPIPGANTGRPDCWRLVNVYHHEMPCACLLDPAGT